MNEPRWATRNGRPGELVTDVLVVGGGTGGCAAALAAARSGRNVVLTEETDWIGGQLTQQAVPPDEHPWIEQFGATRSYRAFRDGVRDYYRRTYPLTGEASRRADLNPGNGNVSRLCHEPRAALAVLSDMLAPHLNSGRLALLLDTRAVSADMEGDRVRAVTVMHTPTGHPTTIRASYVIDATELGDLLPLTGTEFVTGAESQAETGEPHAPSEAQPDNHQAFTCCFAMDYLPGEDHTIDPPAEWAFWRDYVPAMTPPWTGPLLSLIGCHPITLERRGYAFDPERESSGEASGLWRYRRILHAANFERGSLRSDVCLVNWPMNDYWLGNLVGVSAEEADRHVERAKQLSLSLLYWLQTAAPRSDGGEGWRGLRLRRDIVGTPDGLAKYPYMRESRRIRAEFTVVEQHVGTDARAALTGRPREEVSAEPFADSVGVGSYRIDLHPSSGGDNYIDVSSLPFQIPLGSLVPVRVENLIPGCKNLGVTHITNGCYRLHPVEWNIGEAAGALAAYCIDRNASPRATRASQELLSSFQSLLRSQGMELAWPRMAPR
ncbi:FAD-dependent oxidoreductase [Candidatus Poribacteria bacterium]|nr:FAD-dependent oxidoreductase [Candidatus Poribacteria bacterium]